MTNGKTDRYSGEPVDSGLGETQVEDIEQSPSTSESESTQSQGVPHRVRYESPKENRTEVQFLLDDVDSNRLQELEALSKKEFDETVYRTDVKLAGLRAGIQSSEKQFLTAMRDIGYGYFD